MKPRPLSPFPISSCRCMPPRTPLGGLALALAVVGTDADPALYQAGDSAVQRAKRLGDTGVVPSVSTTF